MAFTTKKVQTHNTGIGYIKWATLFFLGMSCVMFAARAFEIEPMVNNAIQWIGTIYLNQEGNSANPAKITLSGANGNGYFDGTVKATTIQGTTVSGTNIKGTTITGTKICLVGDTCITQWPTGGTAGGESIWSTWTTANKIYYNLGNVGIWLADPLYPLHVNGTLFANTLSGDQICLGGICRIDWPTGGTIVGGDSVRSSWTNKIYYTSGNVGIGTNSPLYALDISGDVKIQNTLNIGDSVFWKIYIDNSSILNVDWISATMSNGNGYDIYINWWSKWANGHTVGNVILANKQWNVGIGTNSPDEQFQIGQYARIGQNYTASTTWWSFLKLYWEKPETFEMHPKKYTPNIQLDYRINNFMTTPTVHNWQIDASDALNFNYANGDNNYTSFMKITSAGNVGIGTSTPTEKFTVNWGIWIHGNGSAIWDFELYNNTSTTTLEWFMWLYHILWWWATPWVTTVVGKNWLFLSTSASIDSGGIFISTGGNVGIGTATPTAKLQVNWDIKIGSSLAWLWTTTIYKSDWNEYNNTSIYTRCSCDTNYSTGSDCSYTTWMCYNEVEDGYSYPFNHKYIYYTLEQGYACTTPWTIIYKNDTFWWCSGWTKENPALPTGMYGWKQLDI